MARERRKYIKRAGQTGKDELRAEYKRSDFSDGFVRGKYASRIRESSNIVVLNPEVAEEGSLSGYGFQALFAYQ